jgi:SAM-dependent methyltransferase
VPDSRIRRAARLFLHPSSPAACYRNPYPLVTAMVACVLNTTLRVGNRLAPARAVVCPLCGWTGSRFGYSSAASVNVFRSNDVCLQCGGNLRTRRMMAVLAECVDLSQPQVIVDVGPAGGTRRFFVQRPHLRYLTVDLYRDSDVRSPATDIALPDAHADAVMCCHVLEHIDDDRRAMAEIRRILKPGGLAILMVPQQPGLKQTRRIAQRTFDGYGHIWDYGDDFCDRVQQVGLVYVGSHPCERQGSIHVFRK